MRYNLSDKEVHIPLGKIKLEGELVIPPNSKSLVIFSHGSGSSRFSTRNNFVARELQKQNIGTFLFDLLTREEDELYSNRFNIDLLSERLVFVTNYIISLPQCTNLRVGYFGASTGAASAIRAAVALPKIIETLVSRGGRPDLAFESVPILKAPTLLIVGELDYDVLELNRKVYKALKCEKKLEVVPGATHLFEETGTLQEAALLARDWFSLYLQNTKMQQSKI